MICWLKRGIGRRCLLRTRSTVLGQDTANHGILTTIPSRWLNPLVVGVLFCICNATLIKADERFDSDILPFIQQHCYQCHGDGADEGDFQVDELSRDFNDSSAANAWRDALDLVRLGEMPPADQPKPKPVELRKFTKAIDAKLRAAILRNTENGPQLRRLSHSAMDAAVHDLLGTDLKLSKNLPADPVVSGFDNLTATMVHSREFMEVVQKNARTIAHSVITRQSDPRIKTRYAAKDMSRGDATVQHGDRVVMYSNKFRSRTVWPKDFEAPYSGRYRVTITALQRNSLYELDRAEIKYELHKYAREKIHRRAKQHLKFRLPEERVRQAVLMSTKSRAEADNGRALVGRMLGRFTLSPTWGTTSVDIQLEKGESFYMLATDCDRLQIAAFADIEGGPERLKDDKFAGKDLVLGDKILLGEQLHLREFTVEGPIVQQWPPVATTSLFPAGFEQRLKKEDLRSFLERGFRDAIDDETLELYFAIYERELVSTASASEAESVPSAHSLAARQLVEAVLCSPRFLYSRSPRDNSDDYAVASRLSFFLWNSIPDQTLLRLARRGKLSQHEVIAEQVQRMLADERSARFVVDFAGQWLGLRRVGAMPPDPKLFPNYEGSLEQSMRRESELFIQHLITENRPVTDLVAPGYAILNSRLAQHYGIENVQGEDFRKVDLPPDHVRGGLLGQASVLTITSNGTSTSPVMRGVWILDNLLDTPPAPPPSDVPPIEPDVRGATTIREQLAKHRDVVTCNQCHRRIDPWGFALENFNPIGQWRTHYTTAKKNATGLPVDTSGRMPNGKTFNGFAGARQVLLERESQLTHALAAKLLMHATGRPVSVSSKLAIDDLVEANAQDDNRVRDLIERVCTSAAFLN